MRWEDERRKKRSTFEGSQTQISFGLAAHANEWAKIHWIARDSTGDSTVQSLRVSLMRLAYASHCSEAAFEYNSMATSRVEAVQPLGDLIVKQGTGWFSHRKQLWVNKTDSRLNPWQETRPLALPDTAAHQRKLHHNTKHHQTLLRGLGWAARRGRAFNWAIAPPGDSWDYGKREPGPLGHAKMGAEEKGPLSKLLTWVGSQKPG